VTIILVDMDGVLADFDGYLLSITGDLDWPEDYIRASQTHRFSTDHILSRAGRDEARRRINRSGFFDNLTEVPGAVDGIYELAELADVWIVTKPLEANLTCRDDKAAWVRRHLGKEWERRLIITPDKSLIRGDVLLDDAPKPAWFDQASWAPVIYPWSFNRQGSDWAALPSWQWGDNPNDLIGMAATGLVTR